MDIRSDRFGTIEEPRHKAKENRKRKYCGSNCCACSRLCVLISSCVSFLIATSIAAILTALLGPSTKTTTTMSSPTATFMATTTILSNTTTTLITTANMTTTSMTTTTNISLILLTSTDEVVQGLWNTTAGGDGILSTPGAGIGHHYTGQIPENAVDQNSTTKYTNFGACNNTLTGPLDCGTGTGLFLTLRRGSSLLVAIRFRTANSYPERDPMTITIEGSNQPSSALTLGSTWTLIYNGSTGLDIDPLRFNYGVTQWIQNNTIYYNSYRILITSKRNTGDSTQYGEVEMLGY